MIVPVLWLGSPGLQNKAVFSGHDHWEGGLFWAPDPPFLVLVPSQVSARSVSDTSVYSNMGLELQDRHRPANTGPHGI